MKNHKCSEDRSRHTKRKGLFNLHFSRVALNSIRPWALSLCTTQSLTLLLNATSTNWNRFGRKAGITLDFFAGKLENYSSEKMERLLTLERAENHNLPLACTPFSSNGALAPSQLLVVRGAPVIESSKCLWILMSLLMQSLDLVHGMRKFSLPLFLSWWPVLAFVG